MATLVDKDGEITVDAVEHRDVAVPIVGVATVRVRESDHVANVLAGFDGKAAKEINHVDQRVRAGFVAAEDPGGAAVVVVHVVGFDVEGVETGVLGHGFAVLGDPARAQMSHVLWVGCKLLRSPCWR